MHVQINLQTPGIKKKTHQSILPCVTSFVSNMGRQK